MRQRDLTSSRTLSASLKFPSNRQQVQALCEGEEGQAVGLQKTIERHRSQFLKSLVTACHEVRPFLQFGYIDILLRLARSSLELEGQNLSGVLSNYALGWTGRTSSLLCPFCHWSKSPLCLCTLFARRGNSHSGCRPLCWLNVSPETIAIRWDML